MKDDEIIARQQARYGTTADIGAHSARRRHMARQQAAAPAGRFFCPTRRLW